jgi:integrase/recombinase XerC
VPLSPELRGWFVEFSWCASTPKDDHFVFSTRTGGPLSHRNVQRQGFEPARDRAGLPAALTSHSLRHAFASLAAHNGVPISVLSEVLGHSDVGVTQQVYVDLYNREQVEDAFRLAMSREARS